MNDTKVTASTITRTVILVLALVNQILTSTGHAILPIKDETVTEVVSVAFTIVTSLVAWWKNNSFTKNAIKADKVLKNLKAGE